MGRQGNRASTAAGRKAGHRRLQGRRQGVCRAEGRASAVRRAEGRASAGRKAERRQLASSAGKIGDVSAQMGRCIGADADDISGRCIGKDVSTQTIYREDVSAKIVCRAPNRRRTVWLREQQAASQGVVSRAALQLRRQDRSHPRGSRAAGRRRRAMLRRARRRRATTMAGRRRATTAGLDRQDDGEQDDAGRRLEQGDSDAGQ